MKNYNDLLSEIEDLSSRSETPGRKTEIAALEQTLNVIELSLHTKKLIQRPDLIEENDILESFFRNIDLKDWDEKLRGLRNRLDELNKISNLQQIF